jgi:hypothetical protein
MPDIDKLKAYIHLATVCLLVAFYSFLAVAILMAIILALTTGGFCSCGSGD